MELRKAFSVRPSSKHAAPWHAPASARAWACPPARPQVGKPVEIDAVENSRTVQCECLVVERPELLARPMLRARREAAARISLRADGGTSTSTRARSAAPPSERYFLILWRAGFMSFDNRDKAVSRLRKSPPGYAKNEARPRWLASARAGGPKKARGAQISVILCRGKRSGETPWSCRVAGFCVWH